MGEDIKDSRGNKIGYTVVGQNNRTYIHDKSGAKLGYLQPWDNKIDAYDKLGSKLAVYESNTDTTYDKFHNKIGKGNLLMGLFFH